MQKTKTLPQQTGAMSMKQLCLNYNICFNTLKKRLAEVPDLELKPFQKRIYPNDLQKVFSYLGHFN